MSEMNEDCPLDTVEAFIRRFVHLPTESAYTIATLWVGHTYFTDHIPTSPRLAIISPEYGCGKSRFLEVLEALCFKGKKLDHYTRSYLMRLVSQTIEESGMSPTLLVDEIDTKWKSKSEESDTLRAFINTGYRDSGVYGITEGEGKNRKATDFRTFAPVALAGKGEVLPESVMTRSIIIRLQKRPKDRVLEKFLRSDVKNTGNDLNEWLTSWAESVGEEIADLEIPLPATDRDEEVWLPLASVAYVAGGEWPRRLLEALSEVIEGTTDLVPSRERELLADILSVWTKGEVRMRSSVLIQKLHSLPDRDYLSYFYGKPIDERMLAKYLRPYEIKPRQSRFGVETYKAYELSEVERACSNYLDPIVPQNETIETFETELFE